MSERIELGDKVKDSMSGIEGIAFARTAYLTGCDHIGIKQSGVNKDGKSHDLHWVDEPLTLLIEKRAFAVPNPIVDKTGGPSLHSHSI
jgi:hypothetical protein